MYFQDSLPRLPIPELDDSLEKYLKSAAAVTGEADMERTRAQAAEFGAGVGKRLQYELKRHDAAHPETSYISGPWYDMYLENRDAFPLNLSPQLTWKDDPDAAKMGQTARTANILAAAARFLNSLRAGILPPDLFVTKPDVSGNPAVQVLTGMVPRRFAFYAAAATGSYALDMSQYAQLFSTTRVPRRGKDELVTQPHDKTFVVVQRGTKFYKVHIMGEGDAGPLSEEQIESQLNAVMADTPSAADELPVGVLSAINRDWAAEVRPELVAMNPETMGDLDAALFCVTLDDAEVTDPAELSRLMLHGSGRNRWFEKSFHVVVTKNGKAGVNWEHSWGDGVAMLRFFNDVYREIGATPARPAASFAEPATPMKWTLSPRLASEIRKAEDWVDKFFASAELEIMETPALTKADLKAARLSPDGTMQMLLQLAHVRMHGYQPATYESATTAAFRHGRTETIRSATLEAVAMCQAFQDDDCPPAERLEALRAAADQHSAITRDAMTGKGFDRHLFALRHTAARLGYDVPELFADPVYQNMMDIRLSTSTLTADCIEGGGFGPISPRAYSIGYGIVDEGSRFHVMTNGLGTAEFLEHVNSAISSFREAIYGPGKA